MPEAKQYCSYCGRVAHRCLCAEPDSSIRQFLERAGQIYQPLFRDAHYKRGVPPQIKKRERATIRKHYQTWYRELVIQYGDACLNCGEADMLVVDHVLPIAKGGLSTPDNFQLLCSTCNRIKGKLVIDCRDPR